MPDNVQNNDSEHTLLDVEDDDDRERRLRRLLRKTDSSKGTASSEPRTGSSSKFDFGVHDTHEVEPPTQLLQRLRTFLPQMEADNAALLERAQANPESVDIEHLDHPDAQYIEMNLGLGVFTMRGTGSSSERSSSPSSSSSQDGDDMDTNTADVSSSTESDSDDSSDDSNSSSTSSSDSSSDSGSNSNGSPPPSHSADHGSSDALTGTSIHPLLPGVDAHPRRPMRPLPTRARPSIVVLGETDSAPEREQSP